VAITFRAMDIYLVTALIYLLMSYPCSVLIRYFERRVSRGHV
jgi:ABC-type amino acid transport system permease subunit